MMPSTSVRFVAGGSSALLLLPVLLLHLRYNLTSCRYVKILDSHMKFVHGMADGGRGAKYRCPQCSVLVADLETHQV